MAFYKKKLISILGKEETFQKLVKKAIYDRKADISGACIHFYTDSKEWINAWNENFYSMSENIRSHCKMIALEGSGKNPTVNYDPISRTLFFTDCDYYGWIKSAALALVGDVLEDNHRIFSIHGALLDVNGKGVSIIGSAGTGKTTLSYGLMRYSDVKIVADDWHFFNFMNSDAVSHGSEKNTYIRADIATQWSEYSGLVKGAVFDNRGRAVIDVSKVIGKGNVERTTTIKHIILLERKSSKNLLTKLSPKEAMMYMENNLYCNPHILQQNNWKRKVRKESFLKLFNSCGVWLLNTVETPGESLEKTCNVLGVDIRNKRRISLIR